MTAERPSSRLRRITESSRWRSIIRIFAVTIALLGLLLIGNEIWENVSCVEAYCKIHLSTMLWGLVFLSFGLLILQKGDVAMSLQDLGQAGNFVATWWGRKAYAGRRETDGKDVVVTEEIKATTKVETAKPEEPKP